jgi:uncharacterized membrane protein
MRIHKGWFQHTVLIGIFLSFAVVYGLISLVNHYQFRTSGLDLGMFNHALYDFAHFSNNHVTLDLLGTEENYFGDHFSPITILYAPFYYLFGSYTLLIIQILAVLFGGLGVFRYGQISNKPFAAHIILIHFFCTWGIFSALSFDFHNNVVAAMLVPWLLYSHQKGDKVKFLIFFVLILLSKENMALWLIFIMIGLALDRILTERKFALKELKFEISLIVVAALSFMAIILVIIPALRTSGEFSQVIRYQSLGDSTSEIIASIIRFPKDVFALLFESPVDSAEFYGIKSELHFMVIISGGFALFYFPQFLIMLVPIYLQKLLTDDFGLWGINYQYSIEYSPILSICLFRLVEKIKSPGIGLAVAAFVTMVTMAATLETMERRRSLHYNKENTAFYAREHYDSQLNLKEIYAQIEKIPENAIVSASANLAPHLAFRKKIYHFPRIKDAEYLVLFTANRSTYPLSAEQYHRRISGMIESGLFEIRYNANHLLILQRKK